MKDATKEQVQGLWEHSSRSDMLLRGGSERRLQEMTSQLGLAG